MRTWPAATMSIATGGQPAGIAGGRQHAAHSRLARPALASTSRYRRNSDQTPYITPGSASVPLLRHAQDAPPPCAPRRLAIFPAALAPWTSYSRATHCLQQTRKAPPAQSSLFGETYWRKLINFQMLAEEGMISPADLQLFEFAESAEQDGPHLVRRGLRRRVHPRSRQNAPYE